MIFFGIIFNGVRFTVPVSVIIHSVHPDSFDEYTTFSGSSLKKYPQFTIIDSSVYGDDYDGGINTTEMITIFGITSDSLRSSRRKRGPQCKIVQSKNSLVVVLPADPIRNAGAG